MKKIYHTKTFLDNLFLETYNKKDKSLFGKLLKSFNDSKTISKFYVLIENLLDAKLDNESQINDFIQLNINEAKKIPLENIEQFSNSLPINEEIDQNPLLESICVLLFEERNWLTFHRYENAYKDVFYHLKEKINNKNDKPRLTESEYVLMESILKNPKEVGKKTILECIDFLDKEIEKSEEQDLTIKIFETKDKLYKMLISEDIGYETVVDLLKLKNELLT